MSDLKEYEAKRDFTKTAEPKPARPRRRAAEDGLYVIQKHAATRLHYDLRLELDGVLKSWAVTRGPSLDPAEKRLAVAVEDHPLAYGDFEGTIPKGQYGGGNVIVWDTGTWTPEGDPHRGLAKGHLAFEIRGEKLAGRWHLVRMPRRRGEKRENWLLIKSDDDAARTDGDVLTEKPLSLLSGRSVEEIGEAPDAPVWTSDRKRPADEAPKVAAPAAKGRAARGRAAKPAAAAPSASPEPAAAKSAATPGTAKPRGRGKAAPMPDFVAPCLATLERRPPRGDGWVHEIKLDGYRVQAHLADGEVVLRTRSGQDWTDRFGDDIPAAIAALPAATAILDGEIVVDDAAGASDFAALQAALSEKRTEGLRYVAFDLLYRDGEDLRGKPLIERKAALSRMMARPKGESPLRYSEHLDSDGELMLGDACRRSLEGVVSKRAGARYRSGRQRDWVKSKCAARQEFVVAGFVPSTAERGAIGSLSLGYYEDGNLVYAGRVGTGFRHEVARDLYERLSKLKAKRHPFAEPVPADAARGVTWVEPKDVAEVEFRAWTGDRILRHAAFRGLREDKPAAEVVREVTTPPPEAAAEPPPSKAAKTPSARGAAAKSDRAPTRPAKAAKPAGKPLAGHSAVTLTHPERVYWPADGVSKQALADYYAAIWRWIAPHIVARPLSLLRCPDGIDGQCFFQKQPGRGVDKHIHVFDNPGDGGDQFLAIEDLDGLVALVQMGVLEIHPWGATVDDLDHPDRMILDLDPGDGVGWETMKAGARTARDRLAEAGLESFLKTTGGKGLHVVVPLAPEADWDTVKAFSKSIAEAMATAEPGRYTATLAKKARTGRIFVDYLRNGRGNTAVAAYSSRARPGAHVSVPLGWDELDDLAGPATFGFDDVVARLEALDRPVWPNFFRLRQRLPAAGSSPSGKAKRRRG